MPDTLAHERILVTGGSGFVGQHLLRALVAFGGRPTAITRSIARLQIEEDLRDAVDWIEIDWLDQRSLDDLWRRNPPELLFHLAGVRIADSQQASAELNQRSNLATTEGLLRGWARGALRRLIAVGTAEEYGDRSGILCEKHDPRPVTAYGTAKAQATAYLLQRFHSDELPVVILRPFSVYGPLQPRRMFVAQAVNHAVDGQPFAMTSGTQRRDLVFVSDLVRALLMAAKADEVEGKIINIGSGQPQPLIEVAELIWRMSGTAAPLLVGARPAPPEELHDTWADISRAGELLNWRPDIDLERGLQATIDHKRGKRLSR